MVQTCYVPSCSARQTPGVARSYHRFPRDEKLKSVWLDIMGRRGCNPSEFARVCGYHFTPDCFEGNGWSKKRTLLLTAIPTIFDTPGKKGRPRPDQNTSNESSNSLELTELLTPKLEIEELDVKDNIDEFLEINNGREQTFKIVTTDCDIQGCMHSVARSTSMDIGGINPNPAMPPLATITKQSNTVQDPLSLDEIVERAIENNNKRLQEFAIPAPATTNHLRPILPKLEPINAQEQPKTKPIVPNVVPIKPKRSNSKKEFDVEEFKAQQKLLVKQIIKKKTAKIKIINQRNRRLRMKLENLTDTIEQLEKENEELKKNALSFPEGMEEHVQNLYKQLLKPKMRFTPKEIKEFAIELRNISPKAYMFVRESLGHHLPHTTTMQKWKRVSRPKKGENSEDEDPFEETIEYIEEGMEEDYSF